MIKYPKRKDYRFKIIFGKKLVELKYKQATAEDTVEYLELLETKDILKIKEYWLKRIKKSIDWRIYHKWNFISRIITFRTVSSNFWNIIDKIQETLHKTYLSIYDGIQEPKIKGSTKGLFDNSYSLIAEETLIPIDELYKRLTYEQILWWLDKIRFDFYNMTDEGKKINKEIIRGTEKQKYENITEMIKSNM